MHICSCHSGQEWQWICTTIQRTFVIDNGNLVCSIAEHIGKVFPRSIQHWTMAAYDSIYIFMLCFITSTEFVETAGMYISYHINIYYIIISNIIYQVWYIIYQVWYIIYQVWYYIIYQLCTYFCRQIHEYLKSNLYSIYFIMMDYIIYKIHNHWCFWYKKNNKLDN